MTSAPPKGKRIYLINRDFQLRYVRLAVVVGLASTLMTSVVILYPLFQFQILRFPGFLPAPFMWAMALAAVVNLASIACIGVLITHRIAGPMFSLVRHFRTMIQTSRLHADLKVRDSDDLKYVVRNFNELMAHMRGLIASDRERLAAVIEALRASAAAKGGDEGVRLALASAEALEQELTARLGGGKPDDRTA